MFDLGRVGGAGARDHAEAAQAPGKRTLTDELGPAESGQEATSAPDRAVPVPPAPGLEQELGGAGGAPEGGAAPAPEAESAPAPQDDAGAAPAPSATPTPAPSGTPAGPGANIAASFNAREVAHPTVAPFGGVAWNANEPVATYAAYRDGASWRFRLESLSLDVPVGVASGGKTNVPGASAPVVTASTWRLIASDLTPGGGTPNRSPRTRYWAEDLTWIHERFHFNEFNTFLRTSFGSFEATIEGSGYTEAVSGASDTEAAALGRKRPDLRTRLLAAWNQAKTNMSSGMEDRAYDDGVPLYQARADAVRSRARTEGWSTPPRGGRPTPI